jgi:hypothetical protein
MARDAVSGSLPDGRRYLADGVTVFRVASLAWMIVFNVRSGDWQRAWLAYASLAIAATWTAWLSFHRDKQDRSWVLRPALSARLVLSRPWSCIGWPSPTPRPFFATGTREHHPHGGCSGTCGAACSPRPCCPWRSR